MNRTPPRRVSSTAAGAAAPLAPLSRDSQLAAEIKALVAGGEPAFGVSDVLASFFFSPARGGLIWGVGPVISLPSTTLPTLGTEKWSAGPTAVVLKQ